MIRKRYTAEFKAQAIELVGLGKPVPEVAEELGLGTSILYRWVGQGAQPAQIGSAGLPAAGEQSAADELRRLRRENTSLKLENDIFKKGRSHPRHQKPADARAMIEQIAQQTGGSTRKVCAVLGRPRSSYYHAAAPTASQLADAQIGDLIESVFKRHRRRYGYRRIAQELADRNVVCAPARIRRIMAQRGLRAIAPRNFVPKPATDERTGPHPISWLAGPCPRLLIASGRVTSRSFLPVPAGFTWPSSSISARAASLAGAWPITCARIWCWPPSRRQSAAAARAT